MSASRRCMFVFPASVSASVVRWDENLALVIGIQETVGGAPMCAISISKPSPFTAIIPSKAVGK